MRWLPVMLAVALSSAATDARAQTALTAKLAHLRAGPSRDYPVVAVMAQGSEVLVQGCLADYSWCDVLAGPLRGWMYAANIDYAFEGRDVPLLDYGAQIGIAVLGFSLFDYWGSHYVDRPFYRDRDQWNSRPRPPRSPGAGLIRPVPRPVPRPIPPGAARQAPGGGAQRPPPPRGGTPERPRPTPPSGPIRAAPRPEPHERGGLEGPRPAAQPGGAH